MAKAEKQYIIICQQIVCADGGPVETVYGWDGERYPSREQAKSHGFRARRSDDFNIGVLEGNRLVSFDWMDKPIEHELAPIAEQLGLTA